MTELIIKAIEQSSVVGQIVIGFLVCYIMVRNMLEFNNYKNQRKHKTVGAVMAFTESILANMKSQSVENCRKIMMESRSGKLTDSDISELNLVLSVIIVALKVETVAKLKQIIKVNGYYKLVKAGKSIDKMSRERSEELRNISKEAVDSVVRENSPLFGIAEKRFSYEKSLEMFSMIVARHCEEIDLEVSDINEQAKKTLWIFAPLFKYEHKDEDLY